MKSLHNFLLALCLAMPCTAAAAPAAVTDQAKLPAASTAEQGQQATAAAALPLTVKEAPYPPYLGGDTAYPLVDTRRGTAWYLDIGSIYAELYQPPEYILTAYVIKLDEANQGNSTPGRMVPLRIRYNTNSLTMYYDREPGQGKWQQLTPNGNWLRNGVVLPAGEAAYYLFYEEKFFGRRKYPLVLRGKVVDNDYPFPESFYASLRPAPGAMPAVPAAARGETGSLTPAKKQ